MNGKDAAKTPIIRGRQGHATSATGSYIKSRLFTESNVGRSMDIQGLILP
jgi:hypothetical protein